ncbi:MAG: dihydrolipoyl dehydrogenase [Thermoanaerobaculia bacterium]|nr:dihydrolipoyl dehydrogenase [Thermoanaerobaculia bacterium]
MKEATHDLVVIGAGPGGYVAAIRAAQLGLDVACIEKEPALGGTCLRVGCIPSKALLEASERYVEARGSLKRFGVKVSGVELDLGAMQRHRERTVKALTQGVAGLLKKNAITRYAGHGRLDGPGVVIVDGEDTHKISCQRVILATGSVPSTLPGVEFDGEHIVGSTEALEWREVPEHLVVIGAGYIGLELGSVWARLGSKVTVLEYLDRILPGMDGETAKQAQRLFKKQGLQFVLRAKVTGASVKDGKVTVQADGSDPIECDRLLVAVGRRPSTEGLGLDSVGIETDERGRIVIDEHWKTSVDGVYAIGDVVRGPMLAHKAEEEGVACVEALVEGYGHVNYDAIPGIVYTHPEIASVGKTEEQLKDSATPYKVGKFPFMANGRAKALAETDGQVKILAHAETDRILGAHVIGPRAGDLIAELVVAMEFGASAEDVARSSHAHPTLAEVVKEAALAVHGRTLNI